MGLADGPTEVHKITVARQVLRDYRPVDGMWPSEWIPGKIDAAKAQVRRPPRARGREPVIDDRAARALDGRRRVCPARASRIEHRLHRRRLAERDLRDPPRRAARRAAHPAAHRAREPRRGHLAGVADHRGARRHRRAAHAGDRRVRGHRRARPGLLPHGLRRRLVADGPRDGARRQPAWPAPFDTDLDARKGLAYQLVDGIALLGSVDWQAKGLARPRPARRLPRAPGRPLDGVPRAHQGPRAARLRRGRGVAARPQADRLTCPASCTATTSSPT